MDNKERGAVAILIIFVVIVGFVIVPLALDGAFSQTQQSPSIGDASSIAIPAPNYVVDGAGKLSPTEVEGLRSKLASIADDGHEIAVLIVPTTGTISIEEYGIAVADKWRVGDKETDNGVILIIAANDHKLRIEVGRGAEATLTDAKAGDIIRTVIAPQLKLGNWADGVSAGIDAINANLE